MSENPNNQAPDETHAVGEEVSRPWSRSEKDVLGQLGVSPGKGLSENDVDGRRRRYGPNRLRQIRRRSALEILAEQFKSIIVILLAAAAVLAFAFGEIVEGGAIVAVLLLNAAIGFGMEWRALRTMEALRKMGQVETAVRRGGEVRRVRADSLVPGDVVLIDSGDVVTADLRLFEANKLQANESSLTGESVPVGKRVETADEDTPLAERHNMLYKGTAVTRGSGEGVVVATGMGTELGRISSLVEEVEEERAPIQKRLDVLGRRLVWVTLVIAALVAVTGIVAGRELFLIISTAIALAVAAVPEGLPIVATIAMSRGMRRMARRNALVENLSAVETLGSTSVILTDKTGTLTENQMFVTGLTLADGEIDVEGRGLRTEGAFKRDGESIDPDEHATLRRMLFVGVLCSNANLQTGDGDETRDAVGDPMEVALLVAGAKAGLERQDLLEQYPEAREEAFDPDVKMMATFHKDGDGFLVAVKGAPEAVLQACTHIQTAEGRTPLSDAEREQWLTRNESMAEAGRRMLAAATRQAQSADEKPYERLTFLGLFSLLDPPREDVEPAMRACHEAGVRVVMVTGDQASTARNIAAAVGLVKDGQRDIEARKGSEIRDPEQLSSEEKDRLVRTLIFARASPEHKLRLIDLHQQAGDIVAMIGDGVNDAPALRKSDIGVAMGQRGTQVARETADMILRDDAFSTIVEAVRRGRIIFGNIRNFVRYLLSCNISEIMVVGLASAVNAPLPLLPLQILFLNLVTDVFPALALGAGEGEPQIMKQPPRPPEEPVLTRGHWYGIAGYGSLITVAVLGALAVAMLGLRFDTQRAVTVSFLTLAFAQLWHVFNMRRHDSHWLRNDIVRNVWVWAALGLCTVLLVIAVYFPPLAVVLETSNPGAAGWGLILGMSVVPLILGQAWRVVLVARRTRANDLHESDVGRAA